MLTRTNLRSERGTALITAILVLMIMLPLGLALLSIVDMQTRASGSERMRDRAFNLADSALSSAAFSLSRAWPASAGSAPSNAGSTGTAAQCSTAAYGAQLGAPTNPGSATAKLQPNLNASYTDSAYTGATWQINVCDDDLSGPPGLGRMTWKDALLTRQNYDQNHNQLVWVRAQATVAGQTRALAALVRIDTTPALSSRFGLIAGRMNSAAWPGHSCTPRRSWRPTPPRPRRAPGSPRSAAVRWTACRTRAWRASWGAPPRCRSSARSSAAECSSRRPPRRRPATRPSPSSSSRR
jgi:Tfp pilus assembly protein PilX